MGDGGRGDQLVAGEVVRVDGLVHDLDPVGQLGAHPSRGANSDLAGVDKGEVVEGEHGVAGQVSVVADAGDGLEELVVATRGKIVEAVEAVGDVADLAARRELAQLDHRDTERPGVGSGHVAVLAHRQLPGSTSVRIRTHD